MKKITAVLVCVSLFLLSGCSGLKSKNKIIVASFYPIYIFTLNITNGIDGVEVFCMAEQSAGCLHDYQLLARDVKLLSDAEAFVINGAGMESFVDDVVTSTGVTVVDSSAGIELISEEHNEEEHDEEEHDEEEHDGHDHGANSHIWMSVDNAVAQVKNISDGLKAKMPEYSEQIVKNTEEYLNTLFQLKTELEAASTAVGDKPIITFHEAYDYMARELSLNIVDSIESDEGGEPSAKELASLSAEINNLGVRALFTEPYYKGSAAGILSRETEVKIFVLNPVTRGEKSLTAYEDIMRSNIDIIKKAVG